MFRVNRFKPYQPDVQAIIRLEEALPPEHPVHVFVDLVGSINLDHFVIAPGPKGEKPYHPHALFGILAWGYLHGLRSSRKLARLARQEATFVYLAGGGRPNFRTLARFRRDNAAAFSAVFRETVLLALRLGLAKLGHVALDGTKLKAGTSKHKAMSYGRMQQREAQLKEEIARLLEQAEGQDQAEDQEYGADSDGYSVDEELAFRAARLAKIEALRAVLEAEKQQAQGLSADEAPVIEDKEQRSFADTDARMMLMKRGEYDYGYNAQAVVDAASGVIVAAELTNVAADVGHLPALAAKVRAAREIVGLPPTKPTTVSADAGYFSGDNAAEDGAGLDPSAALRAGSADRRRARRSGRDAAQGGRVRGRPVRLRPGARCLDLPCRQAPGAAHAGTRGSGPADQAPLSGRPRGLGGLPAARPLPEARPGPPDAGNEGPAGDRRDAPQAAPADGTPELRATQDDPSVPLRTEPVFGQLKENRGFTGLSLRGLALATGEYLLACLAHNLGKLLRVWVGPSRAAAVAG